MAPSLSERQQEALGALNLPWVRFSEPLAPYTRLGLGGPADALVRADGAAEDELRRWARRERLPLTELECGTSCLVRDGGLRGVVLLRGQEVEQGPVRLFEAPKGGSSAAELLRRSDLSGVRIRGARLLRDQPDHLAVDPGASSHDVEVLVEWARRKVAAEWGVELVPALVVVGTMT